MHPTSHIISMVGETSAAHELRVHRAQEDQVHEALTILRRAGRPVTWGFIRQQFSLAEYRSTKPAFVRLKGVKRIRKKNKVYYTIRG